MAGQAPRLFIEGEGSYYPDGSYRIAQNPKTGDIGLAVYARQKRWQRFGNIWYKEPSIGVITAAQAGLLVLLVGAFPFVVAPLFVRR